MVERHVANVNVVGSSPITRFTETVGNIVSASYRLSSSLALVAGMFKAQTNLSVKNIEIWLREVGSGELRLFSLMPFLFMILKL